MYNLIYSNHRLTFGNFNVGYEIPYASITYSTVDHGTVSGVATAQIGSTVTVTATPSTGYTLSYITVNGTQIQGNSFVITGDTVVGAVFAEVDPYNPLGLPANTVRVRTSDGNPPPKSAYAPAQYNASYETATLVPGTTDTYDVYKSGTSFYHLLFTAESSNVVEVLGANTTGITDMQEMFSGCSNLTSVALFDTTSVTTMNRMFYNCSKLTSVALFDTSSVTNMDSMFYSCSSLTSAPLFDTSSVTRMTDMFNSCSNLTSVPLFNTSSATNMNYMFNACRNVESGAYALFQQADTQAHPPSSHTDTFSNCGSNTGTGRSDLAQIPMSWGGLRR